MKLKSIAKASALATALAVAGPANAAFFFDINGDTALGGETVQSVFDWFPGNALFVDAARIPVGSNKEFDLLLQASLNLSDLAGGTEVTFQARIPLRATVDSVGGTGTENIIDLIRDGGVFDMYYDDPGTLNTTGGMLSDDISGDGYGDGRHILHGAINPTAGPAEVGGITIGSVIIGLLDDFGADNLGGTLTHRITGNVPNIEIAIAATGGLPLGFDASFFPLDVNGDSIDTDGDFDLLTVTDNLAAFTSSNPSAKVVGTTPDFGADLSAGEAVNNNRCGATPHCDIQAESDGRTPFEADLALPEPSTTVLLSLGLLGIGASMRRRGKS